MLRTVSGGSLSAHGAYRVRASVAPRQIIFLATGTEVATAIAAADLLEAQSIGVDVVSMPSWRHFDTQSEAYRAALLPHNVLTVSIEAGTTVGWQKYVGRDGLSIGVDTFGVSAPAKDAFRHFGLDRDAIAQRVTEKLKRE